MNSVKQNTIILFKKSYRALISLLIAFLLLLSLCPINAFAAENASENNQLSLSTQETKNGFLPKIDAKLFEALFKDFGLWDKETSAVIQWGTNAFVSTVLGLTLYPTSDKPSKELELLQEISKKQDDIMNGISNLYNFNKLSEINKRLEEFKKANGIYFVDTGCGALAKIDKDYESYLTGKQPLTEEIKKEIEAARKDTVLRNAGISDYASAATDLDKATYGLGKLITEDYLIGQQNFSLFALKQMQMRHITFWEHQAWDEIDAFNTNVISTYMSLALFNIASLKARIEWCEANGISTYLHKEVLKQIKNSMCKAISLYNKYQLPKDTSYRHFWNGTQDLYFDQTSISYTIPKESYCGVKAWEDHRFGFDRTDGYQGDTNKNSIKENFWSSVKPKGAITTDIVNKMLQSATETSEQKAKPNLKDILELGRFNNLPNFEKSDKTPVLLFDAEDKDNAFSIKKTTLRTSNTENKDNVACWIERMPQLKGTKLNQNTLIKKDGAHDINTYSYQSRTDWIEGFGNKYYYRVQDKRNANEEYFSLLVREKVNVNTNVKNDYSEDGSIKSCGYITPSENLVLNKGVKVKSFGNTLKFYDAQNPSLQIGQQVAQAYSNYSFSKWSTNDKSLATYDGGIEGIINSNTTITAEFEKGVQVNINSTNDGLLLSANEVESKSFGFPLKDIKNLSEIWYRIESNNVLHIDFINKDGHDENRCYAPKDDCICGSVFDNWDIQCPLLDDGLYDDWNRLNMDELNKIGMLNIVASFKEEGIGVVVDVATNDEYKGRLYGSTLLPSYTFWLDTKDGIVEVISTGCLQDDHSSTLTISWTNCNNQRKEISLGAVQLNDGKFSNWKDLSSDTTLNPGPFEKHIYKIDRDNAWCYGNNKDNNVASISYIANFV